MTQPQDDRQQAILSTISEIPKGRVSTYGLIATLAGYHGNARYVGYILKQLTPDSTIPWHRVVNASGRSSFPSGSERHTHQLQRLQAEQVVILQGRISLKKYRWPQ